MQIKELDQRCGECDIIEYCGNGFCICTNVRFEEMEESEYKRIAEQVTDIKSLEICNGCTSGDCGPYISADGCGEVCGYADEAQDFYCEQIAASVINVGVKRQKMNNKMAKEALESGWIPFTLEYNDEQRQILACPLPEDEQEILVTDGKSTWQDTFMGDGCDCWLDDSGDELVTEVIAWQPLPEPYRGINDENINI